MKGIWFNDIHSYADLNLILSAVNIPPAVPKTTYIDIPGADGSADLTEVHGEVKYKDRECSFTFTVFPYENFEEKKTYISNLLNGKRCKIRLDKDAEYYWLGRCKVNEYASDRSLNKIVVSATVAPYKLKHEVSSVFVPFCGKNILFPAKPKVVTSNGVTWKIESDGKITASGTPTDYTGIQAYPYDLLLGKGTYTISFSGTCEGVVVDLAVQINGVNTPLDNSKPMPYTFTVTEPRFFNISFKRKYKGIPVELEGYPQLEINASATAYEAYTPSADPVEVTLTNGRKTVAPTITCTGETTVTVNDSEYVLGEGTHKILDIQLHEGDTAVTLAGTGSVAIIYQEGDL